MLLKHFSFRPGRPWPSRRAAVILVLLSSFQPLSAQLPSSGLVTAGSAAIQQGASTLVIAQQSQNASLNWQSFSIGAGNKVTFLQPNSSSVTLNHVLGSDPSNIFGTLSANGNIFLLNPNGILFAPGSQVSVGGLVASSLNLLSFDFESGQYLFENSGHASSVSNHGKISAGSAAFLSPQLLNSGSIDARGGNVILAAADAVTVRLLANGLLTANIDKASLNAAIQNHGQIHAPGGSISLLASAIADSLINTDGILEAHSLLNQAGHVYLNAGENGTVRDSGSIDVAGLQQGAQGGGIELLGRQVGLLAGANLNASGEAGGGSVLIGGNWHGQGPEMDASATYMDPGAHISVDATGTGNGGEAVLWSNDYTGFFGSISARGGPAGGSGGHVETSSHNNLQALGTVDTSASLGVPGSWLLDPADVTISTSATSSVSESGGSPDVFQPTSGVSSGNVSNTSINNALNAGTSVTITTANSGTSGAGTGNINVNAPIAKTGGGNATLLLKADGSIQVNSSISSTSNALNVTLDSHASNNTAPGSVLIYGPSGGSISTNGGNIVIGGGLDPTVTPAIGISNQATLSGRGVQVLSGGSLNAGGGNVSVLGQGVVNGGSADLSLGIDLVSFIAATSSVVTSGNGSITIIGSGAGSIATPIGISMYAGNVNAGVLVSSQNGSITLSGTAPAGTNGLLIGGSSNSAKVAIFSSGSGTVSLNALGGNVNVANGAAREYLGWDGVSTISSGALNLTSTNGLMNLSNPGTVPSIKSNASGTALSLSAALGIQGNAQLTTSNGSIAVANSSSGGITMGTLNAGSNAISIQNGVTPGAGTDSITIANAISGGTVSIDNNRTSLTGSSTAIQLNSTLTASGPVEINAQSGNVVLNSSVSTSNTSATAIKIGAGSYFSAGTATGGNVQLSGSLTTGTNGQALVYSGQVSGTSGFSSLSGTGRFRYGQVYGATSLLANAPSSGVILQYREQPTLTLTPASFLYNGTTLNDTSLSQSFSSFTSSGWKNGDSTTTLSSALTGNLLFNGSATTTLHNAGSYSLGLGTLAQTYGYALALGSNSFVINQQPITIAAATSNKTYDGTTGSSASPTITSGAIQTGDSATLSESYANRNAGTGLTVNPLASISDGNNGNNYAVTLVTNTASVISPAPITITAGTNTKTYDGTTSVATLPTVTSGAIQTGDSATFTEAYASKNAGTGLTVNPLASISDGNSGNNYAVTLVTNTASVITPAPITITAGTNTKTYDGTTSAATLPTITSGAIQAGDSATFTEAYASKNAGTGLTVNPLASISDGNNGNNYAVTLVTNTASVISPAPITITAGTNTKTYDGTTSAAALPTVTSGAIQTGDSATFTEAYASQNAGTGLTVNPLASISDGNSGNNYAVTLVTNTASTITPAPITITAGTNTKTYDGTTSAAALPTVTSGAIQAGDSATFTEAYASKNAGTGLTVNPLASISDGNNGNNYAVTLVTNTASVITPAPITITAGTNTKTYDGTTSAAALPTITSGAIQAGDSATFTEAYASKNAGTGLTVNPLASISDGNSGNNYAVTLLPSNTSVINKASLMLTPASMTVAFSNSPLDNAGYSKDLSNYNLSGLQMGDTSTSIGLSLGGLLSFNGSTSTVVQAPGSYLLGLGTLLSAITSGNYLVELGSTSPATYTILPGQNPVVVAAASAVVSSIEVINTANTVTSASDTALTDALPPPSNRFAQPGALNILKATGSPTVGLRNGSMKLPENLSDGHGKP